MSNRPLLPSASPIHFALLMMMLVMGRCADAVEHARIEAKCGTEAKP